jgi:hypothetical protein
VNIIDNKSIKNKDRDERVGSRKFEEVLLEKFKMIIIEGKIGSMTCLQIVVNLSVYSMDYPSFFNQITNDKHQRREM